MATICRAAPRLCRKPVWGARASDPLRARSHTIGDRTNKAISFFWRSNVKAAGGANERVGVVFLSEKKT